MSLIAIETIPATPDAPITVKNDGWYPDIELAALRDAMRLDGTVTDARLKQAVIDAVISVNTELAQWKHGHIAAGHETLASVPADQIAEESVLLAKYRRAVYSAAKADLIERYRDYDTTSEGGKKADSMDSSADEQRRNARWAIADILQQPHMTVELI